MVVDPTEEEEKNAEATMSVVCDGKGRVCAIRKPGGTRSVTHAQIAECVRQCAGRTSALERALQQ